MDDMQLLKQFAEKGSQPAFSELVSRHVNWVYGVCRRRVGDATLAQDVTQAVFIVLAQKAGKLPDNTILAGWLMNTARFASADALKRQARRRRHERRAAEMMLTKTEAPRDEMDEQELMPRVDEAMAVLPSMDRDALALRFYQHKSFAEVARVLGLSEDAAKKRVSRGLEKLRSMLGVRAAAVSATALAGMMMTGTAQAAPAGLQAAVVAAATTGQATAALAIAKGAMSLMAWAKAEVTATAVVATIVLGAWATATVYQTYRAPYSPRAVPAMAPTPVAPPAPAPASNDDSFTLNDGAGFSRKLDRKLLRFTDSGGAFNQFHLIVPVSALPGRGNVTAEVVVERRDDSAAILVRSMRDRLPYAYIVDNMLIRLDPTTPGTVIIAQGVAPDVLLKASQASGGVMTELTVAAAERKRIDVDLGSMIDELQRRATSRSHEEKFNAVRLSSNTEGGRVVLVTAAVPGTPPVSEFNVSETVRLAVGVRDIRVDPLAASLPQVSLELVELLELQIKHVDRGAALGDLLPPPGFFDNPDHHATAIKLNSLFHRRNSGRGLVGDVMQ